MIVFIDEDTITYEEINDEDMERLKDLDEVGNDEG